MLVTPEDLYLQNTELREREIRYRQMLAEAAGVFREYATRHKAKGPKHLEKALRNEKIAGRIEHMLQAFAKEV